MANSDKIKNIIDLPTPRFFGKGRLPLTILLREYSVLTDRWHRHCDFGELVVILSGSAINDGAGDKSVPLRAGNVMYLAPGSYHRYRSIHKFRHYNLLFFPEILASLPEVFRSLPNYKRLLGVEFGGCSDLLHISGEETPGAVERLENMRSEFLNHTPGWEASMLVAFYRVLVYILRHAAPAVETAGQNAFQIGRVIRYMSENSDRNFSLAELAAYAQMSASGFRHQFRSLNGMAPIEYMKRLRLRRAALMLMNTDLPITVVALRTGFADGNYFARSFHRQFGRTPREFRNSCLTGAIDLSAELDRLFCRDMTCQVSVSS